MKSAKLLTISVAAYNVELYLEELIESVISSKYLSNIELFIINDGSQDGTFTIAQKYATLYPDSVFAIDKENENYGSTVNTSLSLAKGKYFKLLDGDDWYNTSELDKLIEGLKENDVDLVITPYTKVMMDDTQENTIVEIKGVEFHKVHQMNEVTPPNIGMWSITYRTEMIKAMGLKLPTGISYTDTIYSTYPMSVVQTYVVLDCNVYQYRLGRDGQTVSVPSVIKSIDQLLEVNYEVIEFLKNIEAKNNLEYLENRVASYFTHAEKALLLDINKEFYRKLIDFDQTIKRQLPSVYSRMTANTELKLVRVLNIIRKNDYWPYWGLYFLPRLKKW